jgi:hypothetical protein
LPDEPTPDAHIVALAVPLLVTAATVGGIAIAMARDADALHCPVDNALADGPPLWVHEGEIERCFVAALPVKDEDLPRSHRSSTGPENASQPEAPARAGRRRSGLAPFPSEASEPAHTLPVARTAGRRIACTATRSRAHFSGGSACPGDAFLRQLRRAH